MVEVRSQRLICLLLPLSHLFPGGGEVKLRYKRTAERTKKSLPSDESSSSNCQPVFRCSGEVTAGHLQFESLRPAVDSCRRVQLVQLEFSFLWSGLSVEITNGFAEVGHHLEYPCCIRLPGLLQGY